MSALRQSRHGPRAHRRPKSPRTDPASRIQRRVRIQDAQLPAAKVLQPQIWRKSAEIPPTFQRAFLNREYASSNPPRSARQSDNWRLLSLKSYKCPPIAAFCRFTLRLQAPDSAQSQSEIADSLWQIFEIFPFLGDDGRRPGSIYTAWRRCAPAKPPDYESVGQS